MLVSYFQQGSPCTSVTLTLRYPYYSLPPAPSSDPVSFHTSLSQTLSMPVHWLHCQRATSPKSEEMKSKLALRGSRTCGTKPDLYHDCLSLTPPHNPYPNPKL